MSLLVWLPLNGNLNNQGLNDMTFSAAGGTTGLSTSTSGKIGSCYQRTAAAANCYRSNTTVNLNGDITMMCWAKVTDTSHVGDTANGIITNHSHSHNTGVGITVKQVSSTDYRISCSTGTGSSRTYYTYYGTSNIKGAWHHLCLSYSKSAQQLKLWVDGVCEYTLNSYINGSRADYIDIFNWSTTNYTSANYRPFCMLNDVRVYDECLSPKEINEISKGLVLHYPMNEVDGVIGGRNYLRKMNSIATPTLQKISSWNYDDISGTYTLVCSETQSTTFPQIYVWTKTTSQTIPQELRGKQCILAYESYTITNDSYQPRVFIRLMDSDGNTISGGEFSIVLKNEKYKVFTMPTNAMYMGLLIRVNQDKTTAVNDTLTVKGITLQLGDKVHPWITAVEDCPSLAFDNKIYDASGYGYDGTSIADQNVLYNTTAATNNSYALVYYTPSPTLVAGAKYRCTICVTPAANVTRYSLYTSGGYLSLGDFPVTGTAKQVITKEVTANYYENKTPAQGYNYVTFYRFPNDGTVTTNSTIHWCIIEKIGSCPTWSNDSVIGAGSYSFNGSNKFILGPAVRSSLPTDEITVNWWGSMTNWTNYGRAISCTEGGGLNFEPGSAGNIAFVIGTGTTSNTYQNVFGPLLSSLSAGWHMFTGTYNGLEAKFYVDGELKNTVSAYTTKTPIYYANNAIFIGAEALGNQTTPTTPYFNGLINDVRIYATALSADDVTELYKTRYSVANNGTLFCNSVSEDNNVDYQNLIFNGDLKIVNGTTVKGFSQPYNTTYGAIRGASSGFGCQSRIPLTPGCTYRYSFDYYIASWTSTSPFYMAVIAVDNLDAEIKITQTNLASSACHTTLAAPLNNGDTTVTITNPTSVNTAWNSYAVHQYSSFSIFENLAYGYNRASYVGPKITQYSNGVVTLASAWTGGSFAAGTKVSVTRDGSNYIYPNILSSPQNYAGSWRTMTGTFTCNSRYSMRYAVPHTLNYSQEVYFRNIRIENITEPQFLSSEAYKTIGLSDEVKFQNNGQLAVNHASETGLDIRYIRDYLNGSTANGGNHWCEIQAFNDADSNCCWGIMPTTGSSSFTNPGLITDGSTATSPYAYTASGNNYVQIDLYKVRNIKKLKIWHYWSDNRSYNNKTQVSIDGTNWITVFDSAVNGTYAETSEGHTIDLTDEKFRIYNNGTVKANKIIEC